MKKFVCLCILLCTCLALFTGCKGNPLPQGMDEQELIDAGRDIVTVLNQRDYDAVLAAFRTDIQSTLTTDDIAGLADEVLDKAGPYQYEDDTLATGQTDKASGEFFGVAVILVVHNKDSVLYRVSFDTNMTLLGLSIALQ